MKKIINIALILLLCSGSAALAKKKKPAAKEPDTVKSAIELLEQIGAESPRCTEHRGALTAVQARFDAYFEIAAVTGGYNTVPMQTVCTEALLLVKSILNDTMLACGAALPADPVFNRACEMEPNAWLKAQQQAAIEWQQMLERFDLQRYLGPQPGQDCLSAQFEFGRGAGRVMMLVEIANNTDALAPSKQMKALCVAYARAFQDNIASVNELCPRENQIHLKPEEDFREEHCEIFSPEEP